jgi:hypothetical protein
LQKASVLTGRKSPTITTSLNDNRIFDVEISGSYTRNDETEYSQGMHTEYVSSDGDFDYQCASDTNCNDSLVNNVPYAGDNISLRTNQWNARIQFSIIPFYKETNLRTYRLRLMAEAQLGKLEGIDLYSFKFGPIFSSIGNRIAIHPKILLGYSRVEGKYYSLIRHEIKHVFLFSDSSYYTYEWEPDSGDFATYKFLTEMGATFEIILNKTFSIFADISGTYQYLFEYPNGEYNYLGYAEFSPGVKINALNNVAFLTGVSLPYNPDMTKQLPVQCFAKAHASIGPFWGRNKDER